MRPCLTAATLRLLSKRTGCQRQTERANLSGVSGRPIQGRPVSDLHGRIAKKHRVAVLRALSRTPLPGTWAVRQLIVWFWSRFRRRWELPLRYMTVELALAIAAKAE